MITSGLVHAQEQIEPANIITKPPLDKVLATVPVGNFPLYLVVSPKNDFVYVANTTDNTISKIAASSNSVAATFPVPYAGALAVSLDGSALYIASSSVSNGQGANSV
jgi:YVTN family beta-propeller protein